MTKNELYYLPATELIKYLRAEKERLIKENVIKKVKPLPSISEDEKPYDLPEGWEWIRLGECFTHIKNGATIKQNKSLGGIPITRIETIANYSIDREKMGYAGIQEIDKYSNYVLEDLDILMSHINSAKYVGKCALYRKNKDEIIIHGMNLLSLRCNQLYLNPYYAYYYFNSTIFINSIQNIIKQAVNQASMSITDLKMKLIPLPPLYIQDQIVQKLDQLSETKDSLLSHAESQFTYMKKMRETLLQEAIRGELVSQDENDEPALILLEKIKSEKERLIKEKVIKKQKELPLITDEEKPYELPSGWEWVRLGEIISLSDNLNIQSKLNQEDLINYLDIDSIDNSNQTIKGIKIEPVKNLSTRARRVLKKDMIVYSMVRPYLKNMAIITEDKENYIGSTGFIAFNSIFVKKEYIFNFLRSDYTTNILNSYITGFNSPSINMDQFNELCIPLPPLAEQERIVAKLDELMATCDLLEAKAEEMKNYTTRLFEASLKEAFMPE